MPANDKDLEAMFKQAKKKPRNFMLAVKGGDFAIVASKKTIPSTMKKILKEKVGSGAKAFGGIVELNGNTVSFKTNDKAPAVKEAKLKQFLKAESGLPVNGVVIAEVAQRIEPVNEEDDEDDAKGAAKPTNAAPHKFDGVRLIYPDSAAKRVGPQEFDIGAVLRAMVTDLEAQGVEDPSMFKVSSSGAKKAIAEAIKSKRADAYVQVGVYKNGSLLLQVRDASDKKWGTSAELRAKYTQTIDEIKAETVAVINADKGDKAIDDATRQQGERFGVEPVEPADAELSKVTGNIVLTAHGTPKEILSEVGPGRVIGTKFARADPNEVVEYLIDAGLKKGYKGKLTLAGCYTGAGGPSAVKEERTFAERVSSQLGKKGYKTVEIISYPGSTRTGTGNSMADSFGDKAGKGKEKVDVASQTVKGRREKGKMSNEEQMEAKRQTQAILKDYEAKREKIRASMDKHRPLVQKAMGKTDDKTFEKRVKLLMDAKTASAVESYVEAKKVSDDPDCTAEAREQTRECKNEVVALAAKIFKGGGGSYDAQVALLNSEKFKKAVKSFSDAQGAMDALEQTIADNPVLQVSGYEGKVNRQGR